MQYNGQEKVSHELSHSTRYELHYLCIDIFTPKDGMVAS